jgi:hypothetical protein
MPGPLAGQPFIIYDAREAHQRCQQKQACVGPGCRLVTGKTEQKRRNDEKVRRHA